MKIIKAKDYEDMSRKAANIISAQVILKPVLHKLSIILNGHFNMGKEKVKCDSKTGSLIRRHLAFSFQLAFFVIY